MCVQYSAQCTNSTLTVCVAATVRAVVLDGGDFAITITIAIAITIAIGATIIVGLGVGVGSVW